MDKMIKDCENEKSDMIPKAFLERMENLLGSDYKSFLESYENDRIYSLRVNRLKGDIKYDYEKVRWCEDGYYYEGITPGKHPFHEAGLYYIQEASAMLPAKLLGVKKNDIVLDLCAAPGGKSTQIANDLDGSGLLISNEINAKRAQILSENIERLGITNAIVTNEDSATLRKRFEIFFDKIMVDAPCSGEGMFKKNPIALTEWSEDNVRQCAARQDEILDNAAAMLKPGGRMVYSTCTFASAENEGSVVRFLNRHPEFHTVKPEIFEDGFDFGHLEWVDTEEINKGMEYHLENAIRLWPHRIKGEGHFAVILEKKAGNMSDIPANEECSYEQANGYRTKNRKKNVARGKKSSLEVLSEKEIKEYRAFEKEYLNVQFHGSFVRFGNQLFCIKKENVRCDEFADIEERLENVKIARLGISLGTFEKNRFEPSHSLALCLKKEDAKFSVSVDEETAKKYISGLSFEAEGEKGWYLLCVEGYSLGWAKCVNGTMKNHYPKGLRKNL